MQTKRTIRVVAVERHQEVDRFLVTLRTSYNVPQHGWPSDEEWFAADHLPDDLARDDGPLPKSEDAILVESWDPRSWPLGYDVDGSPHHQTSSRVNTSSTRRERSHRAAGTRRDKWRPAASPRLLHRATIRS